MNVEQVGENRPLAQAVTGNPGQALIPLSQEKPQGVKTDYLTAIKNLGLPALASLDLNGPISNGLLPWLQEALEVASRTVIPEKYVYMGTGAGILLLAAGRELAHRRRERRTSLENRERLSFHLKYISQPHRRYPNRGKLPDPQAAYFRSAARDTLFTIYKHRSGPHHLRTEEFTDRMQEGLQAGLHYHRLQYERGRISNDIATQNSNMKDRQRRKYEQKTNTQTPLGKELLENLIAVEDLDKLIVEKSQDPDFARGAAIAIESVRTCREYADHVVSQSGNIFRLDERFRDAFLEVFAYNLSSDMIKWAVETGEDGISEPAHQREGETKYRFLIRALREILGEDIKPREGELIGRSERIKFYMDDFERTFNDLDLKIPSEHIVAFLEDLKEADNPELIAMIGFIRALEAELPIRKAQK